MKITQRQLLDELHHRFGDAKYWAFICPNCKDVATGQDFANALMGNPRTRNNGATVEALDLLGIECIGRTLGALTEPYHGRGCTWAAYGLIPGPVEIVKPDGSTMRSFHIAPSFS